MKKYPTYPLSSTRIAETMQIATVVNHAIRVRGAPPILTHQVAEPALTPALALDYLDELSVDIRGAVLLDSDRRVVAAWRGDSDRAEQLREPLLELLERADAAAGGSAPPAQVEVTTLRGAVFCVRDDDWTPRCRVRGASRFRR